MFSLKTKRGEDLDESRDTSQIVPVGLKSLRRSEHPPTRFYFCQTPRSNFFFFFPSSDARRKRRKRKIPVSFLYLNLWFLFFSLIGRGSSVRGGWKCPHKTNAFCVFVSLVRPFSILVFPNSWSFIFHFFSLCIPIYYSFLFLLLLHFLCFTISDCCWLPFAFAIARVAKLVHLLSRILFMLWRLFAFFKNF